MKQIVIVVVFILVSFIAGCGGGGGGAAGVATQTLNYNVITFMTQVDGLTPAYTKEVAVKDKDGIAILDGNLNPVTNVVTQDTVEIEWSSPVRYDLSATSEAYMGVVNIFEDNIKKLPGVLSFSRNTARVFKTVSEDVLTDLPLDAKGWEVLDALWEKLGKQSDGLFQKKRLIASMWHEVPKDSPNFVDWMSDEIKDIDVEIMFLQMKSGQTSSVTKTNIVPKMIRVTVQTR